MPRICQVSPRFAALVAAQDQVVTRRQAYAHGLTGSAIANKRRYDGWQELVTGVFLCHAGDPARRQLLVAAQLFAGADSAIDDVDACRYYGITAASPDDDVVRVVVPARSPVRSRGFVVVRRCAAPFRVTRTPLLRYVDPADAVIAAARRRTNARAVVALVSDAVQRSVVTPGDLTRAHVQAARRNARLTDDALAHIAAGTQSAPEADFRTLAEASVVLPPLLYNRRLRLPSGRVVRPDALVLDAGLVHETNGAVAHRREDLFDDMQERHDAMTEAGLIVLHNSPRRLWLRPREVIVQFEQVYLRQAGRGLPPGVVLLPDDL